MDGSVHILSTTSNSSVLSRGISKSQSLSNLEMIFKTPLEDLYDDRRNSESGTVNMDTTLSSNASVVDVLVGPYKTLEEAQVAASLLKQKTVHSSVSVTINSHQNNNGKPNISTASNLHAFFDNESKDFTWTKPLTCLPTKGNENLQVCSLVNADSFKIQTNSDTSATLNSQVCSAHNSEALSKPQSFQPINTEDTNFAAIDVENYQEGPVSSPKESQTESDSSTKKKSPKTKKEIPSIIKVATLVFFDLETTGLAFEIGKSNVQITEISMIAIDRKEFEQSTFEDLRDIRIIRKLCLCTKPRSMVSSSAAAITGLNNKNLMDQTPFERNAAEAINFFLSHLPKPVCLLAHNGNRYDFPLLKAEFSRLSMFLPPDILIADTLKAFRILGIPVFPPEKKICDSVKFTKRGQVSYSLSNLHLYFFNKNPVGSHSSEGDCITLAKVCHRMKDLILLWIDENCTTFDSVSPLW
ncbi:uncharacterized protein LOC129969597 [Argiope bruennichi]|uniref:uncharacterized protein LOC129969597 n=1 Tax=Argiope bruennichi TaxID=94029 RepID=UPI002494D91C|nr:uncharacterized protein LOC129969597 [Argiope bruennichi]